MEFYVGEASGANLVHQVTLRGKRMLPFLSEYKNSSVTFRDREYSSSTLATEEVKMDEFDNAINSIKAGKTYGEDESPRTPSVVSCIAFSLQKQFFSSRNPRRF